MKCKHENADHLMPGEWWHPYGSWPAYQVLCEQFRCLDCGAWLSLGDSDEHASEAVEIEIRAAELATRRGFGSFANCGAGCERCGFVTHKHRSSDSPDAHCNGRQFHAGYLARCIVTHEDEP